MSTVIRRSPMLHPALIAWSLLMLATAISWWLGGNHDFGGDRRYSIVAIAVVAFAKVHLVGTYFMELRHAPPLLKRWFGTWIVVTCTVVVALYLAAMQ